MKALVMASSPMLQLLLSVCISSLLSDGQKQVVSDWPVKPVNITCMTRQSPSKSYIPLNISCWWDTAEEQTNNVPVTYTLNVFNSDKKKTASTKYKNASVNFNMAFPYFVDVEIWVEAHNQLGKIESDRIEKIAQSFVKTNPPLDVRVGFSERDSPTTLLLNWTPPLPKEYMKLNYEIRFCAKGSSNWSNVFPSDAAIQSFTLHDLQPDTVYILQVRCRFAGEGLHWSDWSMNVTKKTPEDVPTSKPDLWRIMSNGDDDHERWVKFICKDPATPNGRIRGFHLRIQEHGRGGKDNIKNASMALESVYVNRSNGDGGATYREITELKEIQLADNKAVTVFATAVNAAGCSPEAELTITTKAHFMPPVENLKVWPEQGQLWVEWTAPSSGNASEFVVEWVSGEMTDWQRESSGTNRTAIAGSLKSFVRYSVSVVPVFTGLVGKPTTSHAYLEEDIPSKGPVINEKSKAGQNQVDLVWNEIPLNSRRGFITNYIIYYSNRTEVHSVTVPANITSYTLKSLAGDTNYVIWIGASTIKGIAKGDSLTFYVNNQEYGRGQMEGVVMGASLFFLLTVLLYFCKEAVIKCYWIPNPGESTVGHWSPYHSLKVETPTESQLSNICVLDQCEIKEATEEAPEEDQPQRRSTKYGDEEQSSSTSCRSAPDSGGHQGGSSVAVFSGYKGQTPTSHCLTAFSASESTLPMPGSQERLDTPPQEAGGGEGSQQEALEPLDLCPVVEGPSAQSIPASLPSNYMPQLCGYRPQ